MTAHTPKLPHMIVPRYLAGPDTTVPVFSPEWRSHTHNNSINHTRHDATGHLTVTYTPDTTPLIPRQTLQWKGWHLTARPSQHAYAAWRLRFSLEVPTEIPAALLRTLAHTYALPDPVGNTEQAIDHATAPLEIAGWACDLAKNDCAWYSPDHQAVVVTPNTDGEKDAGWLFAARRADCAQVLWYGLAHPDTPAAVIRGLCAELANPAPVPRTIHPGPDTGAIDIAYRT